MTEHSPIRSEREEVVEPEIVGFSPSGSSRLPRALGRVVLGAFALVLGLCLCLAGALLALTIVGAALGVPLFLAGLGAILVAVLAFAGAGKVRVTSVRFPRSWGE